jgi:hypothetical protein
MTSTPPESPGPAPTAEPGSAAPAPDLPDTSAETAPHPPAPHSAAPYAAAPYAASPYGQPGPFAPVVRPPRVPWVNPDRRSHIVGAGVLGGLVVLAAGFGIGYAVAPSGHDGHGPGLRIERGGAYFPGRMVPGPAGQFPVPGNRQHRLPAAPASSAAPTAPAPTSTK